MALWFNKRISWHNEPRSRMRWHFDGFNVGHGCLMPARKDSRRVKRNERTNGRASNARACDRKLSISKSIWPGLPIGCRLISRWIVSNMGILLMARRGIGCTSDLRGLQPRSRALPKSIARGCRYALAHSVFRIKCSLMLLQRRRLHCRLSVYTSNV